MSPDDEEELLTLLDEYEQARQGDADVGEADNGGNVVGDKLAEKLKAVLESGSLSN